MNAAGIVPEHLLRRLPCPRVERGIVWLLALLLKMHTQQLCCTLSADTRAQVLCIRPLVTKIMHDSCQANCQPLRHLESHASSM